MAILVRPGQWLGPLVREVNTGQGGTSLAHLGTRTELKETAALPWAREMQQDAKLRGPLRKPTDDNLPGFLLPYLSNPHRRPQVPHSSGKFNPPLLREAFREPWVHGSGSEWLGILAASSTLTLHTLLLRN